MKSRNSYLRLLERERTAKRICANLNHFVDLKPTLIITNTTRISSQPAPFIQTEGAK